VVQDLEDARRAEPAMVGLGERAMLEAWLEFHRTTLLLKVEGLDESGRTARPVATSALSLHGLVRHMAEVERSWFQRVLQRDREAPYLWFVPGEEDSELAPLDGASWEDDLATWQGSASGAASRRPRTSSTTRGSRAPVARARCAGSTCT